MYQSNHTLEHLLTPWHYTSPDHYAVELERVLKPAWHFVASLGELKKVGDYLTFDLLGTPVILYRFAEGPAAFLNVCSHRHCEISSQPSGSMPAFKCQYHGWEYKNDGRTSRIPEASCFRPFDRENARLQPVRLEACGDLLFATLDDTAPPLADFLGSQAGSIAERFSEPSRYRGTVEMEFEANWKVPVENTLEAYHIKEVHPSVLSKMIPGESHTTHSLDSRFTSLAYDLREHWLTYRLMRRGAILLGAPLTNVYFHHHLHPTFVFVRLDLHAYAFSYLPLSPTRTRIKAVAYSFRGRRHNPLALATWVISKHWGLKTMRTIVEEDAFIFEKHQRGLSHSPFPGCLGSMEERVHQFQTYLLAACEEAAEK
jgi:choline monooxygenase